jgi:hypothetical protein
LAYYTSAQVDTLLLDYYTATEIDTDWYTAVEVDSEISGAIAAIYNPLDYDVSLFVEGEDPGGTLTLMLFVSPTKFRIDSSPIACKGYANVVSTGSTAYDIKKNGASVGTCTFAAATAAASFTIGADIVIDVGDRLSIHGPATADATLADFSITLRGVLEA